MINPLIFFKAVQYYHYYSAVYGFYHFASTTHRAVTYTGRAVSSMSKFVFGEGNKTDKKILELMNSEKKIKDVVGADWNFV